MLYDMSVGGGSADDKPLALHGFPVFVVEFITVAVPFFNLICFRSGADRLQFFVAVCKISGFIKLKLSVGQHIIYI